MNNTIQVDTVIRTARRTIAIIVRRDGKVIVRAPLHASQNDIDRFVREKTAWIEEKLAEMRFQPAPPAPKSFTAGDTFLYLGKAYPLVIVQRARPALALEQGQFQLASSALPEARAVFVRWYQQQARSYLNSRAELHARRFGLAFDRLRITSARTRWGSCSTRGTLSFTWRLVMAPPEVIDYVVIHELAHLVEHNHSRAFWERVRSMQPDFQKHRDWLKKNGQQLNIG